MSWLVAGHVQKGRKALNFSEWSVQAGRKPQTAAATLIGTCADLQLHRMPLSGYLALHPEARVSKDETDMYCAWTSAEAIRLMRLSRGQRN